MLRDIFEKGNGILGALGQIPKSLISGALVGAYQGYRKGVGQKKEIDGKSVALGQLVLNRVQVFLAAGFAGLLVAGPVGAAVNAILDTATSAPSVYLYVKNGSAEQQGQHMADSLDEGVQIHHGPWKGALKGCARGGVSATRAASLTGYQGGRGFGAGLIEGLKEYRTEWSQTARLEAKQAPGAILNAAISGCSGATASLFNIDSSSGQLKRTALVCGVSTALGVALGAALGPLGMALGGATGTLLGLFSAGNKKTFYAQIAQSLERAERDDTNLGAEVSNNNRDIFQRILVSGLAGARLGWNAASDSVDERPESPRASE